MYGCESWPVKKAECWRIDTFELWCWRRLLSVPWTVRRSKQLILKKSTLNVHWKDWCWSWNANIWPPDEKSWLIWNDPDAGKDWRWEKGMTEDEMVGWHHRLSFCRLRELVMDREDWCTEVHGVAKSWVWLSDWTELSTSPKTCLQDSIRHQCTEAVFWHQFQGQRGELRAEICFYSYWLHFLKKLKQKQKTKQLVGSEEENLRKGKNKFITLTISNFILISDHFLIFLLFHFQ